MQSHPLPAQDDNSNLDASVHMVATCQQTSQSLRASFDESPVLISEASRTASIAESQSVQWYNVSDKNTSGKTLTDKTKCDKAVKEEIKEYVCQLIDASSTQEIQHTLELAEEAIGDNRFDFTMNRAQRAHLHVMISHLQAAGDRLEDFHGPATARPSRTGAWPVRLRDWIADQFDEVAEHAPLKHELWAMTWGEPVAQVRQAHKMWKESAIGTGLYVRSLAKAVGLASWRTITGLWSLSAPVRHINIGVAVAGLTIAGSVKLAHVAGTSEFGVAVAASATAAFLFFVGRKLSRQRRLRRKNRSEFSG